MKKILGILAVSMALIATAVFTTSCDLTESQLKTIAQSTGIAASVGWIAKQDPDTNAMAMVSSVLDLVQSNLNEVAAGKTYTEVMAPKVTEFIRSDAVPQKYEPLVLAGSTAALQGIDMLFVLYPAWKEKEGVTIGIVTAFINGAKGGLALADDDPRIIKARELSAVSKKAWKAE